MIETLQNNEQILLMYLADELPPEDRRDVEQMLSVDASLSREFASLQAVHRRVMGGLSQLDDASFLPVSAEVASRRAGREIRMALARPKLAPAARSTDGPAKRWGWLYPTVAAASVAILAMVWLAQQAGPPGNEKVAVVHPILPSVAPVPGHATPRQEVAQRPDSNDSDDSLLIQSLQQPAPGPDEVAVADSSGPQDEISQYLLNAGAAQAGHNR